MFLVYSDLTGDEVSQFLSSKCKGAYGVGDGGESIFFSIGNVTVKRHISF